MKRVYNETDLTWSSIEKDYDYDKVIWSVMKNGMPVYTLLDKNNNKIKLL